MNRSIAPTSTAVLSLVAAWGLATTPPAGAADAATKAATPPPLIEKILRGRYLVDTGGCGDCHTPLKVGKNGPEPDLHRLLSGHPQALAMPPAPKLPAGPWQVVTSATNTAWAGPWGVSFTANLTPDGETGLGRWSLAQFVATIRTGRHLGVGRPVLPPMPIPAYKNFSDADLEAIFSYLQSIPAVRNRVPEPVPPEAANAVAKK
ncbi:MAG: diheme cytochrome c-553 [Caldimonas sp.]